MDSLTAESHAETLAKVTPLLEEGRHEEALPFFELHRSKSDDPIWRYLMALSLACLARGEEGLPLLEEVTQDPAFANSFGIPPQLNSLVRTTALNHLLFETSVENSDPQPWEHLRRYAELFNHREFVAKAVVGLLKATPESPEAVAQFVNLFEDAPPDKVIPVLDEIVNSHPNACQPRALLGSFLQQRGKTALAIRHLKTAHEADPSAMEPHLYLGKIYLAQARFDDAERELSEAMSKGSTPTVALLIEVANCQKATYRYDEALQTMFAAFELDPPTFKNWDLLVDIAHSSGQGAMLAEKLRQATEKYPHDTRLRQRFAMMAVRQDDPLAAREQLGATGIYQNPLKDQALARLAAEVSQALGEPAVAVALLEALWRAAPTNPEACRVYGEALLEDGKAAEAESLLRETARNNPNDRALQISWGRALLALDDAERAHRAFSLASRLDPDDAEAMAEQGRAMLVLGLHDEALNVLKESAKKSEPPLAVTLLGLGAVYEKKGLLDISHDFFRQALLRQPSREDAGAGLLRTRPRDGSGSLDADLQELFDQLKAPFAKARGWLNLLRASLLETPEKTKRWSQAVEPILQTLSPEYSDFVQRSEVALMRRLAQEAEQAGEPEKARQVWRFAVSSNRPELVELASTELRRLDTYEESIGGSGGEADSLASLFSDAVEPTSADPGPQGEAELFAEDPPLPSAEPALPQASQPPVSEGEEDDVLAALFAVDVPEMVPAVQTAVDELFAPQESNQTGEVSAESPFAEDELLDLPLPQDTPEPTLLVEALAEPVEQEPPPAVEEPLELAPPSLPVPAEPPTTESAEPTEPAEPAEPATPPLETAQQPPASEQGPSRPSDEAATTSPPADQPTPGESSPSVLEKELLPIPMAADFSPLTRRQLHYHEALVSGGSGALNPESLAHLLLQSAVGHEPPDPSSTGGQNSTSLLVRALLNSAAELEQSQRFRGAVRVLRTALLYQPESVEAMETLARVQTSWAEWLAEQKEFAHAVTLARDILARQPDNAPAGTLLEELYRRWMQWSSAEGDTAASDLLAVYLDQEKSALQELRQAFSKARASRLASAPPSAPPAVASVPAPAAGTAASAPPAASPPTPHKDDQPEVVAAPPASAPQPVAEATPAPAPAAAEVPASVEAPAPVAAPASVEAGAPEPAASAEPEPLFDSKEEALETLDAAPDDESVAEGVFALYADSMRELTTLLKERSTSNPDQPVWLLLLARAFRRSGSETMAVIQYQKYIKVAPSPEAYEELAQTYEELGKDDFAKMTRRKAERA